MLENINFKLLVIFAMLLTIVDTKSYGKFVLHLYPYQPLSPPKDDVTPIELTESLTSAFEYCKIGLIKSWHVSEKRCDQHVEWKLERKYGGRLV